jgi:hypothetical protein
MIDRVLLPYSLTVAVVRSVACFASRLCLPALVWTGLLYLTLPAMAGFTQANVPKLVAGDPIGLARQGFSVSISADGNTAIVGGPFDNNGTGAAWIFTRQNGTWSEQQKLTGDDLSGAAQMGWSVALSADGKTAIVGGPGDNGSIGAAWVFVPNNLGQWTQQGTKLSGANATTGMTCTPPGVAGTAEQGYAVAISGDGNTAIVGGWADNNAFGAAWVFTRSAEVWSQTVVKLCGTGATGTTNIMQGFSVALSDDGTTAILGAPNNGEFNDESTGNGAAWVFKQSGGTWSQQGKLVGPTEICSSSQQGFSVALSRDGKTAIVGGPGKQTTNSIPVQQLITVEDDPTKYPNGGCGTLITKSTSDGGAWVFTLDASTGEWNPQGGALVGVTQTLSNPGKGFSVALGVGGNTALVGGPTDNANTGAVWVFARSSGTWTQQGAKLVGTGAVGAAGQGYSLALSRDGTTAVIGGALDQVETGAAWVFVSNADDLTVSVTGSGTVTSSLAGIDCMAASGTCDTSYGSGTMVTLTATPDSGYIFTGWSGACSGDGSCVVTMSAAEDVTAMFALGRTFVSSSGADSNPCSRDSPCLTFAGAYANTAAGGEIDVLDPGDYGPLTIATSLTIDGGGGQVVSVLVSQAPAITIQADQSNDAVILRHLRFQGLLGDDSDQGSAGTIGINIISAARVSLESIEITGFGGTAAGSGGIVIAPNSGTMKVNIQDTSAYNNVAGLLSGPTGGAAAHVTIEHSYFDSNLGDGIRIDSTGGGTTEAAIADVSSNLNGGNGINVVATNYQSTLNLKNGVIAENGAAGVQASGVDANVFVQTTLLDRNASGATSVVAGSNIFTYGNNSIIGSAGSGFTASASPQ